MILFLISFKIIAQNTYAIEAIYKVNIDFDYSGTDFSKLNFNNSQSYYIENIEDENIEDENKKKNQNTNDDKKIVEYGNNYSKIINTNLKSNTILSKVRLDEEFFLAKEHLTTIKWKIEQKSVNTILGYKCFKAIGEFRGRIYTVWFTKDIPTKFGPWKLHGLPGLILEAKDHLNEVEFIVQKITHFKENKIFDYDFLAEKSKYKTINLQEYVSKLDENLKSRSQAIISKMSRSYNVINIKYKKYRGLELKYEWEKE